MAAEVAVGAGTAVTPTLPDELTDAPPFTLIPAPREVADLEEHSCPPPIVYVQMEEPWEEQVVEVPAIPTPGVVKQPPPGCCRAAAGASAVSQMVTVTSLAALNP